MSDVQLCGATSVPVRRCTCPAHLGGRAEIDGVVVVSSPCGTRNGYLRHRARGEDACDPCREANAAYRREHFDGNRERNKAYQKARRLAAIRLQEMHPGTWRALLREEMWNAEQRLHAEQALRDGAQTG